MAETQTAYAKSAFSDPLIVVNFIALALTLPEVNKIIPLTYGATISALVAVLNLALRLFVTTHPVSFIAPGEVKPVEVKKLEATKPGSEDHDKLPQDVKDKAAPAPESKP